MPFYDNWGAIETTSVGRLIEKSTSENLLKHILDHAEVNSLLELGPGRGDFSQACIRHELDYYSADINSQLLKNNKTTENKSVQAYIPPLPFSTNSFDVTFASNFLEHMVDFQAASLLIEEMVRVTKPKGLICHRVPDAMAWGMHFWNGDYTHSFVTTRRRVSQLFIDNQLSIIGLYLVSGPFIGKIAKPVSLLGKLIPSWIVGHGADPKNTFSKRIYSLKTNFLAGFLIIGRKHEEMPMI
jgi:SAM-dependent methyltransferase